MFRIIIAILSLCVSNLAYSIEPIRVIGVGSNFVEARHDAFRQAVESRVNTVVVSNRHHRNNVTLLNEILVHSSGYVTKFRVIESRKVYNGIELTIDVVVNDSKIANRLSSTSDNSMIIDGELHAIQRDSFLEQRESGDRLLNSILRDFPTKAFIVNTYLKPSYTLDNNDNNIISIPYFIVWNYNYLRAFHEVVDILNDGPKGYTPHVSNGPRTEIQLRGTMFGNVFSKQQWYTYTNSRRVDMIKSVFENKRPALRVVFMDENENVLSDKCYNIDRYGNPLYDFNRHTKVTIHGHGKIINRLSVPLDFPLELLHKYEVSIIPIDICTRSL